MLEACSTFDALNALLNLASVALLGAIVAVVKR